MSETQWDSQSGTGDSLSRHALQALRDEQLREEAQRDARDAERKVTKRARVRTKSEGTQSGKRVTVSPGPVEASVTVGSHVFTVRNPDPITGRDRGATVSRHVGPTVSDIPITGRLWRVGRSGWRQGAPRHHPRTPSDPTGREALDTRVEVERTDITGSVIQNRTRNGTTLWKP